jgi:antitoxin (DNA-binding transcriptional repressor) of toxin-antitoxin stability system
MDAVERGDSFAGTRDGHQIGELIPHRRRRRFISRAAFARGSRLAPLIDAAAFRAHQEAAYNQTLVDPYAR